ncbi:MAG TPA: hypothetical protein VFS11_11195 [Gemmatimonadales bacterium]|nr:hypothetical protein [Gemmatimonadales bacterium]
MTIFSHILATTAVVQAMQLRSPKQIALAYLFGVAIDVDHAIKAPFYLRAIGLQDKRGYYWRSSLQEPVALLWIIPLCFWLGSVVPIVVFTVHIAMDYSVSFEKMPFYPYSRYVTRGWLVAIPDKRKELALVAVLLLANALLWWARR